MDKNSGLSAILALFTALFYIENGPIEALTSALTSYIRLTFAKYYPGEDLYSPVFREGQNLLTTKLLKSFGGLNHKLYMESLLEKLVYSLSLEPNTALTVFLGSTNMTDFYELKTYHMRDFLQGKDSTLDTFNNILKCHDQTKNSDFSNLDEAKFTMHPQQAIFKKGIILS